MSKRTGDPIGGDLEEEDTRGDPLGGSAEKDTRDPIGDVAEDTRGDPLGDFAHETPKEPVGYCNPPRQFTWKKGQSANPKGRKKGSKNESTILREIMNRKYKIREGKKARTATFLEAMLMTFAEDTLKTKSTKSATFLLNRYGLVTGETQPNEITEDDREVLKAFAKRAAAETENTEEAP